MRTPLGQVQDPKGDIRLPISHMVRAFKRHSMNFGRRDTLIK